MPLKKDNLATLDQKIAARCNIICEWAIYVLVWMLPISKAMIEICAVVAFIAWLVKRVALKSYSLPRTGINKAILLFLAAGILSFAFSTDKYQSLNALCFKMGESIVILFIIVETFSEKKKFRNLIYIMIGSFALLSVDGIYQCLTGIDFIRHRHIWSNIAATGSFNMPTDFAGWLSIMLSLTTCIFLFDFKGNELMRLLSGILVVIGSVAFMLTYARGPWIGVFLGMAVVGFIMDKKVLAGLIILMVVLTIFLPSPIKDKIGSVVDFNGPGYQWRLNRWHEVGSMIKEKPLFGFGLNTFLKNYVNYYNGHDLWPGRPKDFGISYAHNCYLQLAAEMGIVGLIFFLYLLMSLFIRMAKSIITILREGLTAGADLYFGALLGFLSGLIAYLVQSFVDTNMYSLQLGMLFWLVIGLALAATNILKDEMPSSAIL